MGPLGPGGRPPGPLHLGMRAWSGLGAAAAAMALACAARAGGSGTVSPSDFDLTRGARDASVVRRAKSSLGALQAAPGAAAPQASAFEVPAGTMRVEESWLVDPVTQEDVLRGRVTFTPGRSAPACRSVRFVQAARVETKLGQDLDWPSGEAPRNLMRTRPDAARGVVAGYFVDHDAYKCAAGRACSPYFRDSWPNPDESADGANTPRPGRAASLVDYPFGWSMFERISLESCARCVDDGSYLGCARWGATWPEIGDRLLAQPSAAAAPSPTFLEALKLFGQYYAPVLP